MRRLLAIAVIVLAAAPAAEAFHDLDCSPIRAVLVDKETGERRCAQMSPEAQAQVLRFRELQREQEKRVRNLRLQREQERRVRDLRLQQQAHSPVLRFQELQQDQETRVRNLGRQREQERRVRDLVLEQHQRDQEIRVRDLERQLRERERLQELIARNELDKQRQFNRHHAVRQQQPVLALEQAITREASRRRAEPLEKIRRELLLENKLKRQRNLLERQLSLPLADLEEEQKKLVRDLERQLRERERLQEQIARNELNRRRAVRQQ